MEPKKAKDIVEKMLGEAGPDGSWRDDPEEASRADRHRAELDGDDGDDSGDEDGANPGIDGEEVGDPEERFEQELAQSIEDSLDNDGWSVRTFADVGVLTNNKGLVIRTDYGEFQVSIARSR